MATVHSKGEKLITMLFSTQHRGRLFAYKNGLFKMANSDNLIKVGVKGVPDLIGFTFPNIATFVEVKTLAYRYLSKEQKAFMKYTASNGCICIVYREQLDTSWKEFRHGEKGFF